MTRRTKAQIRAEKIAAAEARSKEANALLRELKREAAREEKAAFDAAIFDFGRWLTSKVGADSLEKIAALREVFSDPEHLAFMRDTLEASSTVADDRDDDDGNALSGTEDSTEMDASEQREDTDSEGATLEESSTVVDDRDDDDGNALSGTGVSTEMDTSEQREDVDSEGWS